MCGRVGGGQVAMWYTNENDWHEPDWQETAALGEARGVDPEGLLACHHCVGDEGSNWTTM